MTYTTGSITNIENSDLTVEAKAKVIFVSYLNSHVPYRIFRFLAGPASWPPRMLPEQPYLFAPDSLGVFEDATILVHGDHGSRIARIAPLMTTPQPLSDEDLADMYSVLFAVRSPSLAPGYRQDLVSLQALFRETFLGGTRGDGPPEVYLDFPATPLGNNTLPPFPSRPMSDLRRAPDSP